MTGSPRRPNGDSLSSFDPVSCLERENRGNVHRLLQQIIDGRFVMVGSGQNRKSMAYVENLCAFLSHVAKLGAGIHLYNYADKPDLSMEELVLSILRELGRSPIIRSRVPYPLGYLGGLACDLVAYVTQRKLPISRIRVRKFCTTTTFAAHRLTETGFEPPISLPSLFAKNNTTRIP